MSSDPARDRDEHGRPRNNRPRDQLGRPLPRDQVGVAALPETLELTPSESLSTAQDLFDRRWPFQAHEVLEAAWKCAPGPERRLWQGLAQLAVGVTHAARGNPRGAAALLQRSRSAIKPYSDSPPHSIDVTGLLTWAASCLRQLENIDPLPTDLVPPSLCLPIPQGQPEEG
jgi:hypothetical protein